MAGPSYLPEAIPTELGWAHPLTGEQLDATSGIEDAVAYYKPNAGALSFLDPDGETEFLAFAVVYGLKAKVAIHTFHPVVSVSWDWGDESDAEIGSTQGIHVFPASADDETYTVTATVTFLIQDPEGDEGEMIEDEEIITVDVDIAESLPDPVLVSIAITPAGPFTIEEGADQVVTVVGTYDDASSATLTEGVTLESSDTEIASVADMTITGVAAGDATITATVGELTDTAEVTVEEAV